jgi:hypothetical protein
MTPLAWYALACFYAAPALAALLALTCWWALAESRGHDRAHHDHQQLADAYAQLRAEYDAAVRHERQETVYANTLRDWISWHAGPYIPRQRSN